MFTVLREKVLGEQFEPQRNEVTDYCRLLRRALGLQLLYTSPFLRR